MTEKNSIDSFEISVLGILRSFHDIRPSVLKGLRDWCSHFHASFYIATGDDDTLIHHNLLPCTNQTSILNENHLAGQGEVNKSKQTTRIPSRQHRVERIARIRDNLRSHFHSLQKNPDAIIVVDLDLLQLPSSKSLSQAVRRVSAGTSGVICANGIERFMGILDIEYDTFAMGIPVGPWKQRRLYKDIVATTPNLYHTPFDSCFGGLAVYNPTLYLDESCNYFSAERLKDKCEHQSLHECLRQQNPTFEIGVLGTMITHRQFDATIVKAICGPLGVLLVFYLFFKRKKKNHTE